MALIEGSVGAREAGHHSFTQGGWVNWALTRPQQEGVDTAYAKPRRKEGVLCLHSAPHRFQMVLAHRGLLQAFQWYPGFCPQAGISKLLESLPVRPQ